MYFRIYRPRKTCLDKCLKTPVWEDPLTGGLVNGPKQWFNLNASTFTILIDHYEGNWAGKVPLSNMKSHKTFCEHIDCQWQVFSSSLRKFNANNSDAFISKTKCFFSIFSSFFKSTLNFEHFRKKVTRIADVFPKLPPPEDVLS